MYGRQTKISNIITKDLIRDSIPSNKVVIGMLMADIMYSLSSTS